MTAAAFDVIVIGAGSNGLAAACVLAKRGKRVLVVERADQVGGKRRAVEIAPGYRVAPFGIDCGWAPPAMLRAAGISAPPATSPSVAVSVAEPDGVLAIPVDVVRAAEVVRSHSARDGARWVAFATRLRALGGFLESLYQAAPPDIASTSWRDLPTLLPLGRRFRALGRRDMAELLRGLPMSVDDYLTDELESDVVRAAIGAGGVRDLRQGPRSGGTVFNLLHYLAGAPAGSLRQRAWWTTAPDALTGALALRAATLGAKFRVNAPVTRILVRDDAVAGVVLDGGEEVTAARVISTADPRQTLLGLVDPVWLDPDVLLAARNIRYRGCAAYVAYALDRLPAIIGRDGADEWASVVSLTSSLTDLERAYDATKYGAMSERPHIELTAQSVRWPALAPAGKHVLVARVQYVPYGVDASGLESVVTAAIERVWPGFESSVVATRALTPVELEARFGLTEGAPTHGELALDQILFMRPIPGWSSGRTPIDGLYLAGAGTHPGPDVLGAAGARVAASIGRE